GTPEYLLSGYFRLLVTLGDLPHMIACAGDPARHDRMLDLTGGDAAAPAEGPTPPDLMSAPGPPHLAPALRLAHPRDPLADRNANIPTGLPAVWAALGQLSRAEALATSITDPYRQVSALARVAEVLAGAGQHQQAEAVARSITNPGRRAQALAQVAQALAGAGQGEQAEAGGRSVSNPDPRGEGPGPAAEGRGGGRRRAASVHPALHAP